MKTTVKVSISGIAFNIDEDAYQVLNNYLNTLKAHFNRKPGGKEVVDDIEARLAELLSMRINSSDQVISIADAQEVIRIMGNPSDLFDDEQATEGQKPPVNPAPTVSIRKRLYRDPDSKVIAGVCGGLGNYFGIDPVIFRIIFVVCAIGIGIWPFAGHGFGFFPLDGFAFIVYAILWIAVPVANTPQQKLEMTGKNPSIDDIEQKVRTEQQKVNNEENYNHHSSGIGNLLNFIIRIFVIIIAGSFLFAGAIALIAIIGVMLGFNYHSGIGVGDILDIAGTNSYFIKTLLAIVVMYPLFMLIYWGAKLLFRFKLRDKGIMVAAFLIWLFSAIILGGYGVGFAWTEADSRQESMQSIENIDIHTDSKTLYLNLPAMYHESADNPIGELKTNNSESPRIWVDSHNGLKTLFIVPEIKIRYTSTVDNFQIELRKKAFGRSKRKAKERIEQLELDYIQNDSLVYLSPFMFNKDYPLRRVREYFDVIVYAPLDKKVIIQEPLLSKSKIGREDSWSFTLGSKDYD